MGGLRTSLKLHIREGCLEEVSLKVGLQDEQSWHERDQAGDIAVAGPPEVRMLKNPSLPRAATGNGLTRGLRSQAWLGWAHHLATLSGPTSGKLPVCRAGSKCRSTLSGSFQLLGSTRSLFLRAWPCCPRLRDVGPSWVVHC